MLIFGYVCSTPLTEPMDLRSLSSVIIWLFKMISVFLVLHSLKQTDNIVDIFQQN